jgi:hypothetical protein
MHMLLRKLRRGFTAPSPGASIVGDFAVLEVEGVLPSPRPQVARVIGTCHPHRRRSQAHLYHLAWWKAWKTGLLGLIGIAPIQSELVTQRVGDIELLTELLPETRFLLPRDRVWRRTTPSMDGVLVLTDTSSHMPAACIACVSPITQSTQMPPKCPLGCYQQIRAKQRRLPKLLCDCT